LLLEGKRFKPERAPDLTRELTHTTRVVITASSERALPEGSLRGKHGELLACGHQSLTIAVPHAV